VKSNGCAEQTFKLLADQAEVPSEMKVVDPEASSWWLAEILNTLAQLGICIGEIERLSPLATY
jgi:hypothetical protein